MRPLALALCCGAAALALASQAVARSASMLCVGSKPGCFATIQAALAASHDGDAITVEPGTYAGGVTITTSVQLLGAGAGRTLISGGGPVVTIGQQFAATEPTVSIRGVTITGGLNNSQPDDVVTLGGGVWIPQAAGFATGATVTIADSVVSGNRATPQATSPFCGAPACAFAFGGGIANAGRLTVANTRISDNQSGAPGSVTLGAGGGGISNFDAGSLTLSHSSVTGNRVFVTAPNGSFGQGGGIDTGGAAAVDHSVVSRNTVDVSGVSGESVASAGAINVSGGSLTLSDSTVDHNQVTAAAPAGVAGFVLSNSGGIGIDGAATIIDSTIVSNSVVAQAPDGIVAAAGGGLLADSVGGVTVRRSLVGRNSVGATSANGSVFLQGAGVTNFGLMTLDRTQVIDNSGTARGPGGSIQGGGIWNSNFDGGPPTVPQLTVTDSVVTANRLSASGGLTPQGGGVYTTFSIAFTRTAITGNRPDQCFGC